MTARLSLASLPRGGLIANMLWLVFALSFLWFPYIGMWLFPCQRTVKKHKHTTSWSKYDDPTQLIDYTKLGETIHATYWYSYYN